MPQQNPKFKTSMELYSQACRYFPFGVQLFSRRPELGAFGESPIYFERAKDAHFWDVDGNEFIDTLMGIGPVTLGYCYEPVDAAVKARIDQGILGSINSPLEIEMARKMEQLIPCAEMVRFCKSGGEADAIAVRMARGYTGRDTVLFCGYHGWHDWYLAANLTKAGNLNQHLMPGINPKGVPSALEGSCLPFEFNNLDMLSSLLKEHQDRIACIIMEPTRFKHPEKGFLEGVRELADRYKCVLIFDEVITGFRMAPGGAQEYYRVVPDMATYAKAIANGYPLAAVAGKRDILASQSDNFISSTYWSDTVSLAAGLATLQEIQDKPVIEYLEKAGRTIQNGLETIARKNDVKLVTAGHGYDFAVSFDYGQDAGKILTLYIQEMAARGIHAGGILYTCYTLTQKDIDTILEAAENTLALIAKCLRNNDIDKQLRCPVRRTGFRRLV